MKDETRLHRHIEQLEQIIEIIRAEKEQYKAENELLKMYVEKLKQALVKDRGVVLIPYEGLVH